MSIRVESPPIRGSFNGTIVIAIIVALGIGIFAGTVITKAFGDRAELVAAPVGAASWDAQKLQAMEGRATAEQFRSTLPVAWDAQKLQAMEGRATAEQFRSALPLVWDAQKLAAMAGRVLYNPVAVETEVAMTAKPVGTQPAYAGWDTYKLRAMAGRVLAAGVGAEDPPVKPHIPKRPPR